MSEKHTQNSFDLNELKKVKEQLKKAYNESKAEEEERKSRGEEIPKQPLGQKILGFLILIAIIIGVGFVALSNIDMLFLPKNSVTITVADQYGNSIPGLVIHADSVDNSFTIEYSEDSTPEIINLDVKPGDYTVIFHVIPEGYTFTKAIDNFTLQDGGKVKLKYEFIKENNAVSSNNKSEIEKQLNLILDNKNLWYKDTELDKYSYAVTDLDQNGRMEIISSICQGSGINTYTEIYEVNESMDGFNLCESDLAEFDSQADIIKNQFVVFYDNANKEYHYIFDDLTKNGAAEYYENKRDFYLSDGKISERYLVRKASIYQDEVSDVTYTDLNNNVITEEEYNNFENEFFSSFEKMMVNIEWLTNYTEIKLENLQDSYNSFSISKA